LVLVQLQQLVVVGEEQDLLVLLHLAVLGEEIMPTLQTLQLVVVLLDKEIREHKDWGPMSYLVVVEELEVLVALVHLHHQSLAQEVQAHKFQLHLEIHLHSMILLINGILLVAAPAVVKVVLDPHQQRVAVVLDPLELEIRAG
jgi:hypothetical protein